MLHELQSKATEQQEQIAELGRRVAELEVERADLASRNAMLQKLATIRGDGAAAAADTVRIWSANFRAVLIDDGAVTLMQRWTPALAAFCSTLPQFKVSAVTAPECT